MKKLSAILMCFCLLLGEGATAKSFIGKGTTVAQALKISSPFNEQALAGLAAFVRMPHRRWVAVAAIGVLLVGVPGLHGQEIPAPAPQAQEQTTTTAADLDPALKAELDAIDALQSINGVPIAEIERRAKPGVFSKVGFMGVDDTWKGVVKADRITLFKLGITHQELAAHLKAIFLKVQPGRSATISYDPAAFPWNTIPSNGPQRLEVTHFPEPSWQNSILDNSDGDTTNPDNRRWQTYFTVANPANGFHVLIVGDALSGTIGYIERHGFFRGGMHRNPERVDPDVLYALLSGAPMTDALRQKMSPTEEEYADLQVKEEIVKMNDREKRAPLNEKTAELFRERIKNFPLALLESLLSLAEQRDNRYPMALTKALRHQPRRTTSRYVELYDLSFEGKGEGLGRDNFLNLAQQADILREVIETLKGKNNARKGKWHNGWEGLILVLGSLFDWGKKKIGRTTSAPSADRSSGPMPKRDFSLVYPASGAKGATLMTGPLNAVPERVVADIHNQITQMVPRGVKQFTIMLPPHISLSPSQQKQVLDIANQQDVHVVLVQLEGKEGPGYAQFALSLHDQTAPLGETQLLPFPDKTSPRVSASIVATNLPPEAYDSNQVPDWLAAKAILSPGFLKRLNVLSVGTLSIVYPHLVNLIIDVIDEAAAMGNSRNVDFLKDLLSVVKLAQMRVQPEGNSVNNLDRLVQSIERAIRGLESPSSVTPPSVISQAA